MKITAIHGQKRHGNTWNATRLLLDSLISENDECNEFFVNDIPNCTRCFTCFLDDEEKCPHRSFTKPIIQSIEQSDVIIAETPTYCLGMTGQLKNFFDHMAYRYISHRPWDEMKNKAVIPIDKYFASVVDLRKTVLYIPIAMETHIISYEDCFEWFKRTYGAYGISNVELCVDLKTISLDSRYGAAYVGGGNTFKLLHEIKHSDFAEQIRSYLKLGGVLYGGSAGAIVCGKTIETASHADENNVGITDLAGLDLLDGYDVFCHYNPAEHDSIIANLNRNLYLLFEESGLIVSDSGTYSIGKPFIQNTCCARP